MTKDAVATMGDVLPDDAGGRDAVHVAVISCIAGETLIPGHDVGIWGEKAEQGEFIASTMAKKLLGIVDPFIPRKVKPGERFWLYIYPRQITGLNHQWTHPDIPDEKGEVIRPGIYSTPAQKLASERWLREFCRAGDPSYEELLAAVQEPEAFHNEYLRFATDAHGEIPDELWDHIEVVTGLSVEKRPQYFSCSC